MRGLEPLAEHAKAALARKGLGPDGMELVARADLGMDGQFAEVWVAVSKEELHVFSGPALIAAPEGSGRIRGPLGLVAARAKKPGRPSPAWSESDYRSYALATVERSWTDTMTGSGLFALTILGQDVVVCRFSNSMSYKFTKLAKLVDALREGKELEEKDLEDDRNQASCPKCGRPYPEQNRRVCPKCLDRRALFARVMSFTPRYKRQITLILLCMLGNSLLSLASPYLGNKVLFSEVLTPGGKYEGQVGQIVLLTLTINMLSILFGIMLGRINARMTAEVIYDLKTDVFTALQRLSMGFFSGKQTGSLMTRVNWDAMHLQGFFHDGLPYFIVNSVTLLGVTTIMLLMNWRLAVLVLIPVPFIVWFMKVSFPKLWRIFNRRYRKSSALNALVNDALTGVRVVKAFGKEQTEVRRFSRTNADVFTINVQAGNFANTMFPIMSMMMTLGGLVVYLVGGGYINKGQMDFGTLMTFVGYTGMIYGPLDFMTHVVDWWTDCMNSAQRIFEILDAVPDISDAPDAVRIPRIHGDVELQGVTFEYEPNKPVLHDVSMKVHAGEMIGLVGHSGAGKSTITNLISRLYDVSQGSVSIDGVDVKKIAVSDLRRQIGMVLQDTYLFAGSLRENIAYANPSASPHEIIRAAKAANAHDFICKLPDGYDTVIGRHGQNLSGGERQRISIARALLHNPRVLILDEATASVDTETERQIQEALERLVKGRTTFAIAHRLSTLRNADRLVVMEKGKVVESGTHQELVDLKGVYCKLIDKQTEALKIRGVDSV